MKPIGEKYYKKQNEVLQEKASPGDGICLNGINSVPGLGFKGMPLGRQAVGSKILINLDFQQKGNIQGGVRC